MTTTNDALVQIPALIRAPGVTLAGTVALPRDPVGVVLFAHAGGASKVDQIDNYLARALRGAGLATLRFDLLNPAEVADPGIAQNVHLLAQRILSATGAVEHLPECAGLPVGYVGATVGAAAALVAAARGGRRVRAVVGRNTRIDLVEDVLPRVTAPTLLVVRNVHAQLLEMTYAALPRLGGEKELAVIAGIAPLLEEPRALDQLGWLVTGWCQRYLSPGVSAGVSH
jgi:pimeloyl-ACP methyl ester carboxylesterase